MMRDYGGAHFYLIQNCLGFNNGKTEYDDSFQVIQFVHKADDGTITPGLQNEQLIIMLIDRIEKLNGRFPCKQNKTMIRRLNAYLEACRDRIYNRIRRDVMGELKK